MPDRAAWICISEPLESRLLFAIPSFTELDDSFSSDGMVMTDFAKNTDTATAIAVQGDGKIVVAGDAVVKGSDGHLHHNFAVVRYNADGTLDDGSSADSTPGDSFGTGGKFIYTEGVGATATSMVIQKDGKIIIAGSADSTGSRTQQYWLIVRLNPDGTFDKTFGDDGEFTFPFGLANTPLNGIALQSDGKIVAVGSLDNDFLVARLTSTGDFDQTFNDGGTVTTDFGGTDSASAVAIDNVGNIVVAGAGKTDVPGGQEIAVARYEANGTLDPNFGSGGMAVDPIHDPVTVSSMAILADGEIAVAESDTALNTLTNTTFLEDGVEKFENDGTAGGSKGTDDADLNGIAVMPDGELAEASQDFFGSSPQELAVSIADETKNISLASDTVASSGNAVAVAPDGSVFVAGYADNGSFLRDFFVVKFKGVSASIWGAISGNVFRDLDADHVLDANEKGMANVRVFVDLNNDGTLSGNIDGEGDDEPSALTDAHGNFVIPGISPGSYTIREVVPPGTTQSLPLAGSYTVTVTAAKTVKNVNFANAPMIAPSTATAISGSVFYDWNSNGTRDVSKPTEPDLAGEIVFIDSNKNGVLDKHETQTTTDASGNFTFNFTKGGSVRVAVVVPKGFINTTPAFFDVTVPTHQQLNEHFGLTFADPDDTLKKSTLVKPGQTVNGIISNPLDVNAYHFTVAAGQTISFDEDQARGSSLDAFLKLYDASGKLLAFNDNAAAPGEGAGVDSFLKFKFTTADTYFIAVSDHLNTAYSIKTGVGDVGGGTEGKYALTLS